jgi:anti-sigma factor RsiW
MTKSILHVPDDQLLLYAAGELTEGPASQVSTHMECCALCRARLNELQDTLSSVYKAHQHITNQPLPSSAGPRALLKAQLADMSARSHLTAGQSQSQSQSKSAIWTSGAPLLNWREVAIACVVLAVVLLSNRVSYRINPAATLTAASLSDMPNARFTPGAVVAATQRQVCSDSEAPADIPQAIKTQVLHLYGIASGQSDAYEVDYLITPELGGATDIHNLWPEPYEHTVWNAHVKDQLEDRLRELVCHGDLDLATAQHDISTDWIAAYRKYFHVDQPVPASSSTRIQS